MVSGHEYRTRRPDTWLLKLHLVVVPTRMKRVGARGEAVSGFQRSDREASFASWKATDLVVSVPRALTLPSSEHDVSDRRSGKTSEQPYDADQFVRCAACWCWFDRSNRVSTAAHRGPLAHLR